MTFYPHNHAEREQMLQSIGMSDVEQLFEHIPPALRYPQLNMPASVSAMVAERHLTELAQSNQLIPPHRSFLGAGTYHHYVPPIVADVLRHPSLYTAYTPYQPELSQGTLQAMYEYQSIMATLTGLPVSNASHYDGATALAEAVMLALSVADNKASRVLFSGNVNPQHRHVVIADPIAMGLFEPPGSYGADVVVAEGQSLGLPPTFGGPGLGIFTVRQRYVRHLAGRLVGQTHDTQRLPH